MKPGCQPYDTDIEEAMMARKKAQKEILIGTDSTWKAAWETEDNYWFENFSSRPYALGPDFYDRFRPAFRYGFESAHHNLGRSWEEAEADLRRGWETYEHRGTAPSPWEEIKEPVRDAWERVMGKKDSEAPRAQSE
jgi:hypothetical protein